MFQSNINYIPIYSAIFFLTKCIGMFTNSFLHKCFTKEKHTFRMFLLNVIIGNQCNHLVN